MGFTEALRFLQAIGEHQIFNVLSAMFTSIRNATHTVLRITDVGFLANGALPSFPVSIILLHDRKQDG